MTQSPKARSILRLVYNGLCNPTNASLPVEIKVGLHSIQNTTAFTINAQTTTLPISTLPKMLSAAFSGGGTLLPSRIFLGEEQTRWFKLYGSVLTLSIVLFEK